jgi:hypothetical protein
VKDTVDDPAAESTSVSSLTRKDDASNTCPGYGITGSAEGESLDWRVDRALEDNFGDGGGLFLSPRGAWLQGT